MARHIPVEIDEYFLFAVGFVFLMINYSMPLGFIYTSMTLLGILMYYVSIDQNFFMQIPFKKSRDGLWLKIATGVIFAVGFILFYNTITTAGNLQGLFATTAFGSSENLGKFVYGILIPPVETIFFFVVLPGWLIYKIGWAMPVNIFSFNSIKIIAFFAALFTLFHATSKGIDNNIDLLSTFVFGALSMGMVIYYKEAIQAAIMHIIANSHSIGLFDSAINAISSGALFTNIWFIGAAAVVAYLFARNKYHFKLGVAGL